MLFTVKKLSINYIVSKYYYNATFVETLLVHKYNAKECLIKARSVDKNETNKPVPTS